MPPEQQTKTGTLERSNVATDSAANRKIQAGFSPPSNQRKPTSDKFAWKHGERLVVCEFNSRFYASVKNSSRIAGITGIAEPQCTTRDLASDSLRCARLEFVPVNALFCTL